MRSIYNVVPHHVFAKVRLNKLLISVAVKSSAWPVYFLAVIYDLWLKNILRQHLFNGGIQLREIEWVILL